MKKSLIIITSLILAIFTQSCNKETIKPSSNIVTKQYDYTSFTSINVSDDFIVNITFSETEEKVAIQVNENLEEHLEVKMNNGTLEIGLKNNISINGNETLIATISTAMINNFKASQDSEIFLQNELATENVSINLSGDSKMDGILETTTTNANLAEDSYLKLVGSTDNFEINLSDDSKVKDYGLTVKNLTINLSGDSEGYLTVTESIDVKASGDSELHYKGDATIISQALSGDSRLINEN